MNDKRRNAQPKGEFSRGQIVNVNGSHLFRVTRWDEQKEKLFLKRIPGVVEFDAPQTNIVKPPETNAVPTPLPTESQMEVAERQSLDSIEGAIEKVAETIAVSDAADTVEKELKITEVAVHPEGTPGPDPNCVVDRVERVETKLKEENPDG